MNAETNADTASEAGAEQNASTAAATPAKGKSIIDPKYRGKYKTPDWLAQLLLDNTSATKDLPAQDAKEAIGEIGKPGYSPAREAMPARTVKDGVDTTKLFALATENGLNVAKFEAQKGSHGFEGRIRMTIRNMLQSVVKQRHGLMVNGSFVKAPDDFLRKAGVLEGSKPTFTEAGIKIPKTKPDTAAGQQAEAAAEAPSKLIKSEDKPATDKPATAKPKKK